MYDSLNKKARKECDLLCKLEFMAREPKSSLQVLITVGTATTVADSQKSACHVCGCSTARPSCKKCDLVRYCSGTCKSLDSSKHKDFCKKYSKRMHTNLAVCDITFEIYVKPPGSVTLFSSKELIEVLSFVRSISDTATDDPENVEFKNMMSDWMKCKPGGYEEPTNVIDIAIKGPMQAAEQPPGLKVQCKPFQLQSLQFMLDAERLGIQRYFWRTLTVGSKLNSSGATTLHVSVPFGIITLKEPHIVRVELFTGPLVLPIIIGLHRNFVWHLYTYGHLRCNVIGTRRISCRRNGAR